jgi:hypothetical protein
LVVYQVQIQLVVHEFALFGWCEAKLLFEGSGQVWDGEGVGGMVGFLCAGFVLWLLGLGALEEGVDSSTLHRY